MSAEQQSIVEIMARAFWNSNADEFRDEFRDWSSLSGAEMLIVKNGIRAALQAMLDIGPTARMRVIGGLELAEDEKPDGFPHLANEVFRAMLRAELET